MRVSKLCYIRISMSVIGPIILNSCSILFLDFLYMLSMLTVPSLLIYIRLSPALFSTVELLGVFPNIVNSTPKCCENTYVLPSSPRRKVWPRIDVTERADFIVIGGYISTGSCTTNGTINALEQIE
jgi:hypothetical protein